MPSSAEIKRDRKRNLRQKRALGAEWLAFAMAIGLAMFPSKSPGWVLAGLISMAVLLLTAFFQFSWLNEAEPLSIKIVRSLIAIVVCCACAALYGLVVWPPHHRHALSAEEKSAFENALKEINNPTVRVQLACAPNDEIDCECATDLIPLFGEAHWDISPEIERVTLTRPQAGITIAKRGSSQTIPQKWDEGQWVAMTPEIEQVYQAFANIGIESDETSGPAIPENQINIYVGHERENEAVPTQLTHYMEQIREFRKNGIPQKPSR